MWKIADLLMRGKLVDASIGNPMKVLKFIWRKTKRIWKMLVKGADLAAGSAFRYIYALSVPVDKNKVMFIPFQGDYTCNPKYIAEAFVKEYPGYDIVFAATKRAARNPERYPKGTKLVDQYSFDFYKEIMAAKVIVVNSVEFLKRPCPKRRGQYLIETWHGSLGIKRFDKAHYKSSNSWKFAAELCGRRANYIISNSKFEDDVYRETYWPKTPILRYGHPRNDILVNLTDEQHEDIRHKIEQFYNVSLEGKNLALYAPTFRDNHKLETYKLNAKLVTEALCAKFGGEWVLLTRLHPTIRKVTGKFYKNSEYCLNVTSYPDMQEILVITDVAITDYSSWIYDFMLTRRPGFIFATDLEKYLNERGLYYPLSSTPFPLADSTGTLCENILNFNMEEYLPKVEAFLLDKGCAEDGNASQRVAALIDRCMKDQKS